MIASNSRNLLIGFFTVSLTILSLQFSLPSISNSVPSWSKNETELKQIRMIESFKHVMREPPLQDITELPDTIQHIGYEWIPVLISFQNQSARSLFFSQWNIILRPIINVYVGPNLNIEISRNETEIVDIVLKKAIMAAYYPPFWEMFGDSGNSVLKYYLFDPLTITNELDEFKKQKNDDLTFYGIIYSLDTIELCYYGRYREKHSYFIDTENSVKSPTIVTKDLYIHPSLIFKEKAKIFSNVLYINVSLSDRSLDTIYEIYRLE